MYTFNFIIAVKIVYNIFLKLQDGILKPRYYSRGWSETKVQRQRRKGLSLELFTLKGEEKQSILYQQILKAVHTTKAWLYKQNEKSLGWNKRVHLAKCLHAAGVTASHGHVGSCYDLLSKEALIHPYFPSTRFINSLFHNCLLGNYVHLGKISNGFWHSGFHSHCKSSFHSASPLLWLFMVCTFHRYFRNVSVQRALSISHFFAPLSSSENEIILKLIMFQISELLVLQKWDSSLIIHFEKRNWY